MPDPSLAGRRVAVLATDGFEQSELERPVQALKDAGANVEIVSLKPGQIQGWEHHDKGRAVPVDRPLADADPAAYDALMLPGGVMNPDALRLEPKAIDFIRHFVIEKKPMAAICHGPWTLINAGGVEGRAMTSWPSLEADLKNAGACWVDREVVVDRGLVSVPQARRPAGLLRQDGRGIRRGSALGRRRRSLLRDLGAHRWRRDLESLDLGASIPIF